MSTPDQKNHPPSDQSDDSGSEQTATERFRREIASRAEDQQDSDVEDQLWEGGYSSKAMVGTWVMLAIASIGLVILALFVPPLSILVALGLAVVLWVIGGLTCFWRRLGVKYQLTTQRFIHKKGVLTRHSDRIEVIDIDDVSFSQGPIQRLLGVGTIVLTGSDRTDPTLSMIGIADVSDVAGLIDDTRRKERRRRSLHIEAI
jgi:membrane protein YdbS with pleckstrin-like domain